VIVSNCVVSLSGEEPKVFAEAARVLSAPGAGCEENPGLLARMIAEAACL
jgi:hypothetical protein